MDLLDSNDQTNTQDSRFYSTLFEDGSFIKNSKKESSKLVVNSDLISF
jgi:hypothetical protein